MEQFINGSDTQFESLKNEIQNKLKVFKGVLLPNTCIPNQCDVGFEFTTTNGYKMYVSKNISFTGNHRGFMDLTHNGEMSFDSYEDMVTFIRGLSGEYNIEGNNLMECLSESDQNNISYRHLSNTEIARKVIFSINLICNRLNISCLEIGINEGSSYQSSGFVVFEKCENKLKSIMHMLGAVYPSDDVVISGVPFSRFPALPKFRDVGVGTETNIQASGVIGFTFGLIGFGISSIYKAHKKYEMKKENRIRNFVAVYNSLVSRFSQ